MTDVTANKKHSRTVRKTLTIDGDLAIEIKNFTIEKKADEKTVINDLLRLGLISERNRRTGAAAAAHFQLPSFDKGIGKTDKAELNKFPKAKTRRGASTESPRKTLGTARICQRSGTPLHLLQKSAANLIRFFRRNGSEQQWFRLPRKIRLLD